MTPPLRIWSVTIIIREEDTFLSSLSCPFLLRFSASAVCVSFPSRTSPSGSSLFEWSGADAVSWEACDSPSLAAWVRSLLPVRSVVIVPVSCCWTNGSLIICLQSYNWSGTSSFQLPWIWKESNGKHLVRTSEKTQTWRVEALDKRRTLDLFRYDSSGRISAIMLLNCRSLRWYQAIIPVRSLRPIPHISIASERIICLLW